MSLEFSSQSAAYCIMATLWCAETEGIIQHMTTELIYTNSWSGPVWAFSISLYSILPEYSLSVKCELTFTLFHSILAYYSGFISLMWRVKLKAFHSQESSPQRGKNIFQGWEGKKEKCGREFSAELFSPISCKLNQNTTEINQNRLWI